MPQQVSPSINDDIYPGNKTILQVSLVGPLCTKLRVWVSLRCWDGYQREPAIPPPKKKPPEILPPLGVGLAVRGRLPHSISPPPNSQIQELCLIQELCITRCWVGYRREPDPQTPPPLFFLKNSGYCGVYILWWENLLGLPLWSTCNTC